MLRLPTPPEIDYPPVDIPKELLQQVRARRGAVHVALAATGDFRDRIRLHIRQQGENHLHSLMPDEVETFFSDTTFHEEMRSLNEGMSPLLYLQRFRIIIEQDARYEEVVELFFSGYQELIARLVRYYEERLPQDLKEDRLIQEELDLLRRIPFQVEESYRS